MRQPSVSVENNFSKGLVTEASGLNFPENACTEVWNCKFDNRGILLRRNGFDYEASALTDFTATRDDDAIAEYVWRSPNGEGSKTLVVVQIGGTLYFYEEDIDGPLSGGKESFTITLTDFDAPSAPTVDTQPCQFSSGKGYLFVTHPYCDPFYVTLNAAGTAVTGTAITIKTRDFNGLTPTSAFPDNVTRPTSTRAALDDFDEYNLMNQGWGQTVELQGGTSADTLTQWDSDLTTMPSLGDIWWLFKGTVGFDTGLVDKYGRPNARAPQGYYILDEFLQARDVPSGISGLSNDDVTSSYFRPKTTAFYAGRVWYAGVDFAGYNSKIYFSQIIEHDRQLGFCYQANDPTSEENSDLLPSDGGVVVIPDAAQVIKLFNSGSNLYVFASNGVWIISGSGTDGLGFSAADYSVRRLSNIGALTGDSFVDVDGIPMWWNLQGIWTIQVDQVGFPQVVSLTKETIQSFFDDIIPENKKYAKGAYNSSDKIVQWLFKSTEVSDVDTLHDFDRVLNFNIQKQSWFPWSIDTGVGVKLNGIVCVRGSLSTAEEVDVTNAAGTLVVDSVGTQVISLQVAVSNSGSAFRYLVSKVTSGTTHTITWATETDSNYEDWETPGTGASFDSYAITGFKLHGQGVFFFEASYLNVFFNQINNASCNFQAIWDYASSSAGGRFSNAQEIYRTRNNVSVQQARVKVRGRGRNLQFKFYSSDNQPFELLGWAIWETANSSV